MNGLSVVDPAPGADRIQGPWWVDAIIKIGIFASMACYLMWFLVTGVKADAKDHAEKLMVVAGKVDDLKAQESSNQRLLNFYLRGLCLNSAGRDEAKRANCTLPDGR